jgi:hypothetical protein
MQKKLTNKLISKWSLQKPLYVDIKDQRYKNYVSQLRKNGFCDCETWALDSVISEFILPRLKRFKEVNNGFPVDLNEEKWNDILDRIIFSFEWNLIYNKQCEKLTSKENKIAWKKYNEGMKLFAKYFRDLWW